MVIRTQVIQTTSTSHGCGGNPEWAIAVVRSDGWNSIPTEPDSDDLPKDIRQAILEWLGVDPNTDMDAFFEELYG